MKGILFNDCFIPAIVSGAKVETRRIIKKQPDHRGLRTTNVPFEDWHGNEIKPRYKVGEILYIKEAVGGVSGIMFYRADYPEGAKVRSEIGWANKLFMRADDARHFIKITDVRCERAWEITEEGAAREGVANRAEFEKKWAEINGITSWKPNPYVFVYSFEYLPNYKI